jgi:hypothetical protein
MFKEYVTPGGFIEDCNDYGMETGAKALLYAGTNDEHIYKINDDCCEFLLPHRNNNIIGANWEDLSEMSVVLPEDMSSFGKSYIGTFAKARIIGRPIYNELYFGGEHISVEGMFMGAKFLEFNGKLTIRDGMLDVTSMFYGSSGLQHVTFKNCELFGFRDLFTYSGIQHVTFENCSNSVDFSDYVGKAKEVFYSGMSKLTLKNCDNSLVNTIVKMFEGENSFGSLEIEILD